jgi:hypothetical protein
MQGKRGRQPVGSVPSGAKAQMFFAVMYGLKPVPFNTGKPMRGGSLLNPKCDSNFFWRYGI